MGGRVVVRDQRTAVRRVHFHDPEAPVAVVVAPSVFVAARDGQGRLLLVRRCDSGTWELPGGRVDVGESAPAAAVRETAEETGLQVRITGLVGLFTDPAHVVESASGGEIRQQFVVCFHGYSRRREPAAGLRRDHRSRLVRAAGRQSLQWSPRRADVIHHALSGGHAARYLD